MNFFRILVFSALALLAYSLLRKATLAMRSGKPAAEDDRLGQLEPCARCGVYVDSKEAITRRVEGESLLYCSDRCVQEAEADRKSAANHSDSGPA